MNHLYHLLRQYFSHPKEDYWSCATLVTKTGSSYRGTGAMMFISPSGKTFGLVSGGCLESDIVRRANRVWQIGQPDYVIYDTEDDESFISKLELGCHGTVGVVIHAISQSHHHLLTLLYQRMKDKKHSYLMQCFQSLNNEDMHHWALLDQNAQLINTTNADLTAGFTNNITPLPSKQSVEIISHTHWSISKILSPFHLWVLGGGVDAQCLVELAITMGWIVTVVDHRVTYARRKNFLKATSVLNLTPEETAKQSDFQLADAVICMTHNKKIDAQWIEQLQDLPHLDYVALIGPESRKKEVLKMASANPSFSKKVFGPAGLIDISGDLPESIALSIIAQCHQILTSRTHGQNR